MRGMIELIKRGMNTMKKDFFKHSYLRPNMNKSGESEQGYSLAFWMMLILMVILVSALLYTLLPKGLGAIAKGVSLTRGG